MRLLQLNDDGEFSLVERKANDSTRYAILSHTWGPDGEEITFQDLKDHTYKSKPGYYKILFCGKQAKQDGLHYFWIDTCCIDKSSSQELSEAINSMFSWYQRADRCYAYLADVTDSTSTGDGEGRRWKPAFRKSRWFTRGWTLQELLAPASVEFFSRDGKYLGNKQSLEPTIHEITGIAPEALQGSPLSQFSIDERFSWAQGRTTTRGEDSAYCLLGIFDIQMPLLYAEGREKALSRLRKEIREHADDRISCLSEEQTRMLRDSLWFDHIDTRHSTIETAHAKTCRWLLEKSEYLEWLDINRWNEHRGFLWIKGKPGAGKSTLMKFALAHTRSKIKDRIVISFFFNARGEDMEKSTIGTYRSLLFQLLNRFPALRCVFDSLGLSTSSISANHQWSVESLKSLLEQVIQHLGGASVVCFIDALDECEEYQIRNMIQFFERLGEITVSSGSRFWVCFSSRHYPHITIEKGLGLVLEGQEGHNQDISNYLQSELKIGHNISAQKIRSELQEKASGVFMWVVLVVGILNKEYDRGRIYALRRRLDEIPGDLHKLFYDILTRDSHSRDELLLCIQWLLFARHPLSPEQLYFAVLSGIEPNAVSKWDHDEVTESVIKRFILDSSKGLAETTKSQNQTVQFIHESIRDFLLKEDGLGKVWPNLRNNLQGQSHERLKQCCLTYMGLNVYTNLKFSDGLRKTSLTRSLDFRELATNAFPFLDYAVHNVLCHADAAEGCDVAQNSLYRSFPLKLWIKYSNSFEQHELDRYTEGVSLLYVLAERNMSNLIKGYPNLPSCQQLENERYGSPLFASLATGSTEVVRIFTEALAAYQPPESPATELVNQPFLDGLDQINLGRDFRFSKRRTTLSYLAEYGIEQILTLLLKREDFDVNSEDGDGKTPLWWAFKKGHIAIAKLLIDTGKVRFNWWNEKVRKLPLLEAEKGNVAMIKGLIDHGGPLMQWEHKFRRESLFWAARNGHKAVVKMLLDIGATGISWKDQQGYTPLSWAALRGHDAIFEMLLTTGKADINCKAIWDRTPLFLAAECGHQVIVEMLLGAGNIDVNSKDELGRTPLSLAAEGRHQVIVEMLLGAGNIDVNSMDRDGRTPISYAIYPPMVTPSTNEYMTIIKLLLETGKVNIDSEDDGVRRTLAKVREDWGLAGKNANGEHGMQQQEEEYDRNFPISSRSEAVVKLLLATDGVDVNLKDDEGRTPLSFAVEHGSVPIVKMLLNISTLEIDGRDKYGRTPLWWALDNYCHIRPPRTWA